MYAVHSPLFLGWARKREVEREVEREKARERERESLSSEAGSAAKSRQHGNMASPCDHPDRGLPRHADSKAVMVLVAGAASRTELLAHAKPQSKV